MQNEIMSIISVIAAIISAIAGTVSIIIVMIHEKKKKLSKKSGLEAYTKDKIKQSTDIYVEPYCTEVDSELEKNSCEPCKIFSILDDYLLNEFPKANPKHHIMILADSGMGKKSLSINYYAYNQKKRKNKRQKIKIVPLSSSSTNKEIDNIIDKRNSIIFLDALDEDTEAIKDYKKRLDFLLSKCNEFKRVVITCRRQFFQTVKEINEMTEKTVIKKIGPTKAGEEKFFKLKILYLSPFSDRQVDEYIKKLFKRSRKKRIKAKKLLENIEGLKIRPMLLRELPHLIDNGQTDIRSSYQLHEFIVESWLKRDIDDDKLRKELRLINEKLAFDLYVNHIKDRKVLKISKDELAKNIDIQFDSRILNSCSLLTIDAEGNFEFINRSILDYLFIEYFFTNKRDDLLKWSNQQKEFALEYIKKKNSLEDLTFTDFSNFEIKTIELLDVDFSKSDFTNTRFHHINLTDVIFKDANLNNAHWKASKLSGVDFSKSNLSKNCFNNVDLTDVIFKDTNLNKAQWDEANLMSVDFSKSTLTYNRFSKSKLTNIDFSESDLTDASLYAAFLDNVNFTNTILTKTDFEVAHFSQVMLTNAKNLNEAKLKDTKGLPEWIIKGIDEQGRFSLNRLLIAIKDGLKNLQNVNLRNIGLEDIDLSNINLSGAYIENVVFNNVNLEKCDLRNAILKDVSLECANISNANLSKINMQNVNLKNADLHESNLENAKLSNANLEKANLQDANLSNANLNKVNFQGADLHESNLENAELPNANLGKANLQDANLSYASLKKANLQNANLKNACLRGAELYKANLKGANLKNTILDSCDLNEADLTSATLEDAK